MIPVIIEATGTISKSFRQYLSHIPGKLNNKALQTTTILGTAHLLWKVKLKVKVIPQQTKVAQGVPGRLRLRIFLMFGTTRVVGHKTYAPAAFTPGEIPGTHFRG